MHTSLATFVSQIWLAPAVLDDGRTTVGDKLNSLIKASNWPEVYRGGTNKGVLVRTVDFFDDGSNDAVQVKPATFWHNDIFAPSQLYPTISSPWCPNNGGDGFYRTNGCSDDGPWTYATVAIVITDSMEQAFQNFGNIQDDDYDMGVFYASDANAADQRCIFREEYSGYDCPGGWSDWERGFQKNQEHKGSGVYAPGNPYKLGFDSGGGGVGCHFDKNQGAIDQADAYGDLGNLVEDANCQCNRAFRGNWGAWVDDWVQNTQQKQEFEQRNWLNGGGGLAPAWAADTAACWLTNPRDMINLQNALFWKRFEWNNQRIPQSDWGSGMSWELRKYWGWNEVPIGKWTSDDAQNWDSVIIKLPADACQRGDWGMWDDASCLDEAAQQQLETDLEQFVQQGKLVPGHSNLWKRPGSYVLFVREYADENLNWQRYFFCKNWESPNKKYHIRHRDEDCYISFGGLATESSSMSV